MAEANQNSIGILMVEVSRLMRRSFEQNCAIASLTQSQARTLAYLCRHEGIRQVDLADLLGVQPITLARQIDQLEEMGVLERRPDQQDRRAYQLYLLPAATALLDEIQHIGVAVRTEALQGLNPAQVEVLQHCLLTMRSNLVVKYPSKHLEVK